MQIDSKQISSADIITNKTQWLAKKKYTCFIYEIQPVSLEKPTKALWVQIRSILSKETFNTSRINIIPSFLSKHSTKK